MTNQTTQSNNLAKKAKKNVKFESDSNLNSFHTINSRKDLADLNDQIWYSSSELFEIRTSGVNEVRSYMLKHNIETFSEALKQMHKISLIEDEVKTHIIIGKMKYDENAFESEQVPEEKITLKRSVTVSFNLNGKASENQMAKWNQKHKNKRGAFTFDSDDSDDSDGEEQKVSISFSVFNVSKYGNISSAWKN